MLPMEVRPGFARWGAHLDDLLARSEALWLHGPPGAGASSLAAELAERRGVGWLDADTAEAASAWLAANPRGIIAGRTAPPAGAACVELCLPSLDDHPEAIPGLLLALARQEGLGPELPPALGRLPCPGNLRELHNRLLRWKLLGQLPEAAPVRALTFEAEDLATNLHDLERFLLHRALRRAYGNRAEAAARLGVSRRQLYLLIARHGDPVRGEPPTGALPKRVTRLRKA